jgi:spore germination protein GerM
VRALAVALLVTVVGGGLLAACGVSPQPKATRIEPEDVPFGLLDDQPTTTAVDEGRNATVYLLTDARLVAVDRTVPDGASLEDLLTRVITGPTEVEQSLGITTAVPSGTIASVETSRGIATVDLAASFGDIRSREQLLALGQIVYTLTGQPGIGGVRFTVEGKSVKVPLSDGTTSNDPLSRDDFKAIAPS